MASEKGDGKGKSAHHASTGTLSAVFDAISVELMARRVTLAELYKDIDENRDGQLSFNELVSSGDHRTPSTPATIPTSPTIPTIPTTLPSMAFPPCLTFHHNHGHIYIYTNTIIVSPRRTPAYVAYDSGIANPIIVSIHTPVSVAHDTRRLSTGGGDSGALRVPRSRSGWGHQLE